MDKKEHTIVDLAFDVIEIGEVNLSACPIILIHGFLWNKFLFKELGYSLCKTAKRKVFVIDLRNHGESPSCKHCSTILMTKDVKMFIRKQNLSKVTFVCHSFSSTIAYLIAVEEPGIVDRIIMIDHPPFADYTDKFYNENVLPQFKSQNRFLRTLDPKISLTDAKKYILSLPSEGRKGLEWFLKKVSHDLVKEDDSFKWNIDIEFLQKCYATGEFSVKPTDGINHKILIIRCKNSGRISDMKFNDVKKYNPNAELETVEDSTHLLMFEQEERFLELVKEFLNEK